MYYFTKLAVLLLFACYYADAQPFSPADWQIVAVRGGGPTLNNVTNVVGIPALVFYISGTANFTTNGSLLSWLDTSPLGLHWDLTNRAASTKFPARQPSVAALNNYDSILWNGSSAYMRCDPFANANQPLDVVMVMRWNDSTNGTDRRIFDGTNAATACYFGQNTAVSGFVSLGSLGTGGTHTDLALTGFPTNKWLVWQARWSTSGWMRTNQASMHTGSAGTVLEGGLMVGSKQDTTHNSPLDMALLVAYTNATATSISNAVNDITNFFKLAP